MSAGKLRATAGYLLRDCYLLIDSWGACQAPGRKPALHSYCGQTGERCARPGVLVGLPRQYPASLDVQAPRVLATANPSETPRFRQSVDRERYNASPGTSIN